MQVIVETPGPLAVTMPPEVTVATFVFDDFHETSFVVAFEGETVAESFTLSLTPIVSLYVLLLRVTPETG